MWDLYFGYYSLTILVENHGASSQTPRAHYLMSPTDRRVKCTKSGDITISNGNRQLKLTRVLFAPTFTKNIISIGLLCRKNNRDNSVVTWTASGMKLNTQRGGELSFERDGVLHYFEGIRVPLSAVMFTEACNNDKNQAVELNTKISTSSFLSVRT